MKEIFGKRSAHRWGRGEGGLGASVRQLGEDGVNASTFLHSRTQSPYARPWKNARGRIQS